MLRRKIQDLQHYRRLGLTTPADIERYDSDLAKRVRIFISFCSNFKFSTTLLSDTAG